jgi:hypothetical protein
VWKDSNKKDKVSTEIDMTLNDNRINWNNNIKLKNLKSAKNILLEKRRHKDPNKTIENK